MATMPKQVREFGVKAMSMHREKHQLSSASTTKGNTAFKWDLWTKGYDIRSRVHGLLSVHVVKL